jgi:hypothetical protein
MDHMSINGEQVLGKTTVTIDSGIRLIVGEISLVKAMMAKIPGAGSRLGRDSTLVRCIIFFLFFFRCRN